MRKIRPNDVWRDFSERLDEQESFYRDTWTALPRGSDRKIATENYVLTIGVMFEGFINDLIFAYANRDCSQVNRHLLNCIDQTLSPVAKAKTAFDRFGDFKQKSHLTKAELKEILDPEGRNTSFPDYSAIESRARQWLVHAYANRFASLNQQRRAVINVAIAARNNLAHRSKSSLDRLNDVLEAGPLHGTGLQRNVNRIQQAGHFFKARPNNTDTRATVLARLLREASEVLVV